MQTMRFGEFSGAFLASPFAESFAAEGKNGKLSVMPTERSTSRRLGVSMIQSLPGGLQGNVDDELPRRALIIS